MSKYKSKPELADIVGGILQASVHQASTDIILDTGSDDHHDLLS